jgi:hypothetical protein
VRRHRAGECHPAGRCPAHRERPRPPAVRRRGSPLDQAHASAGRLHAGVADGLGVLTASWTGQAHDAHRDATLNTYQPHLATLQDHAQNLAEKAWQSQYAQQRFHDRVVIILGWALMTLAAFLAILAMEVLFDGAILYGTVMLLAAVVVAIKGAVMALYTDWPS